MKPIILMATLVLLSVAELFAQCDYCYEQEEPLSTYAFRKMMREHYSFTLLGSQTPTSGFKVETNKPSITLKGNILSNNAKGLVVNLELTGGVQNDVMQIFKGDQLNSYFKGSLGFNYLFDKKNNAKYKWPSDFIRRLSRKKVCEYREEVARKIDTMLVLATFENVKPDKYTRVKMDYVVFKVKTDAADDKFDIDDDKENKFKRSINPDEYYRKLISEMIKNYTPEDTVKSASYQKLTDEEKLNDFLIKLHDNCNRCLLTSKIVSDVAAGARFKEDRIYKYQLIDEYEIDTYKAIWTSRSISWINVSVAGSNSTFKLYDATTTELTDGKSFLPALTVTYNYFWKSSAANRYFYIRTGAGIKRVNSLPDLEQFDYNKETVVAGDATESLKTEKTGTAYTGVLQHSIGFEMPVEIFASPWTPPAIPGFYTKLQYSYGNVWINKNKLSLDAGLVWNVKNNDKDNANVLTVVPYVGWSSLLQEYKEPAKIQKRDLSELFSVGLKVGIPVNLGK